ncbi:MAG: putative repeat protein (TIGR01451 family), partial [Crocinitomix sp.]
MGNKASTRSRLKLIYFILIALSSGVSTFSFGQITDNITTVNAPQSQSLVVDYLGEGAGASTLLGFFYLDIDTDKDGIPDFYETAPGDDLDGDGLINAADPDDDNDGILDGVDTAPAVTSIPASYFANGTVASANGSTPGDYWQFLPNSTIAAGTYAGYYEHPGAYLYIDNNANNVPDVLEYTSNNMPPFPVEKDFAATHPILGEFNGLLGDWDYSGSPGATPSERTHTTGKTIYYICDDDFGASQTGNYAASPYFPTYIDSYSSVNSEIDYNIYGTTDPLSTEIPGSIIGLDPAGVDFYKYRWFDELIVSPNRELVFFTSVFWNTGGSQVNTYYSRQEFNPDNAATYPTVNGSTTGDNYGGGTTTNWYPELQNTADHNSLAADVFGGGTTWASIASSPIDGTSPIAILAGDQPWVDMYENWTTDKRIIQYRDVDDCMNATAAGINTVIDDRYGYDLTTDGKDIIIRAKDGKQAHFMIIEPTGDPNSLIIGVEDLYSGGDRDFEDEVFYVTLFDGVSITTTKTDNFTVNQCTDTIQYEVVIKNFGVTTATAVTFDDTPDANTTLEVGSVSTSVGAVTSGNTGGDTDVQVAVGSLALGDSVIIFFNVSVNPGVFPTTTL